jgi:hypothetical protein
LHWTAVDPTTLKALNGEAKAPYRPVWKLQAIAAAIRSSDTSGITGGGAYRFQRRGDSTLVSGPDHNNRLAHRVVGPGVPVAVTRSGQYLLAVRREKSDVGAVVYAFRLSHGLMPSSCDGVQ